MILKSVIIQCVFLLVYLPVGNYTMAFELYSSNKIDTDEITINAESETFSVTEINTKASRDHTRSIIDFYKAIVYPSLDDLDIDISLKNEAGEAYEYDTHIFWLFMVSLDYKMMLTQ